MTTGWIQVKDTWNFFDKSGNKVKNQWEKYNNQWFYLDENGDMLYNTWKEIESKWYFFNTTGRMASACWVKDNDRWYYIGSNGAMQTGWIQLNNTYYYLEEISIPLQGQYKGAMVEACTKIINGVEYSFNADGSMVNDLSNSGTISNYGINFIKTYEGFSAKAYYDGTGYTDKQLTIGYGTTKASVEDAFPNGTSSTCTEEEACVWLKQEVDKMASSIKAKLDSYGVTLNQNQFDALCSFSYNCGTGALFNSTLWRNIISGVRDSTLKGNFQAYSYASGEFYQGLYNRRTEEYEMFISADYSRDL